MFCHLKAIFLFFIMVLLGLFTLFVIPLIYKMMKRVYQKFFLDHRRLNEESDLTTIEKSNEKTKLPIDYTDPLDSDSDV